jgi:hypothetical protein
VVLDCSGEKEIEATSFEPGFAPGCRGIQLLHLDYVLHFHRMNLPQLANRKCGRCTVCCSCFYIVELAKPQWVDCKHICNSQCGIYPERPKSCREFRCQWLHGLFTEDDRPDRLGVVFYVYDSPLLGTPFLTGLELVSGALDSPRIKFLANNETKNGLVLLKYLDGRCMMNGPPEIKKKALALQAKLLAEMEKARSKPA